MDTANAVHEDMFEFATRWYRLGGGPSDEIHSRFGMRDRTFFGQLNDMVNNQDFDTLAPRDAEVMRAVIRRRLWLAR